MFAMFLFLLPSFHHFMATYKKPNYAANYKLITQLIITSGVHNENQFSRTKLRLQKI